MGDHICFMFYMKHVMFHGQSVLKYQSMMMIIIVIANLCKYLSNLSMPKQHSFQLLSELLASFSKKTIESIV